MGDNMFELHHIFYHYFLGLKEVDHGCLPDIYVSPLPNTGPHVTEGFKEYDIHFLDLNPTN